MATRKKIKEEKKEENFEILIDEKKEELLKNLFSKIKEGIKKLKFVKFNQFYLYEKNKIMVKYYEETKQAKISYLNTVLAFDMKVDNLDIIEHKSNEKGYDLSSVLSEIKYNLIEK